MRGWSLPLGRVLGVELRLHIFVPILLGLTMSYASALDHNSGRGIGLWLLMLAAVAVREVARSLAMAWWGLRLRGMLLVPTSGLASFAPGEATELAATQAMERRLAAVGPVANILFGLALWAFVAAAMPGLPMAARPWVEPGHLLRAFVWVNLLLGAMHLMPAIPLDGGRIFRAEIVKKRGTAKGTRAAVQMGQLMAFLLMVAGLLFNNIWFTMMGSFLMLGSHLEEPGLLAHSDNDTVKMRDVMLLEYSTLSASATLEDALEQSVHVLQDVFPVVRGSSMVGAVSRQSIVEALAANGNGYVQGVMTKSFQTAHPDDSLVKTLRRVMAGRGAQLLPVLDGERVVGIITPQNLAHSVGTLNQSRRFRLDS